MKSTKKSIKRLITDSAPLFWFAAFITKNIPRVFVYHRFCKPIDLDSNKVDYSTFEWQIKQLKKRWNIISFNDYVVLRKKNAIIPPYSVILTIDDGYYDFYQYAYPILKKYKFVATLFPTVNFVSRKKWLWHDKVHYVLSITTNKEFELNFNGKRHKVNTTTPEMTFKSWKLISDFCISISDVQKERFIRNLEQKSGVAVPKEATNEFSAVTWDQLQKLVDYGIEIGSHTMNHPVLTKIRDEYIEYEICESKRVLETKLNIKVDSFCYPNSGPLDINNKIINCVVKCGYSGAVHGGNLKDYTDLYRIPRVGISRDKFDFLWKLCGMEFFLPYIKKALINRN